MGGNLLYNNANFVQRGLLFSNAVSWIATLTLHDDEFHPAPFAIRAEFVLIRIITKEDYSSFDPTIVITNPKGETFKVGAYSRKNLIETCLPSTYLEEGGTYTLSVELRSGDTVRMVDPIRVKVYSYEL